MEWVKDPYHIEAACWTKIGWEKKGGMEMVVGLMWCESTNILLTINKVATREHKRDSAQMGLVGGRRFGK
jgi:hypothetical protein